MAKAGRKKKPKEMKASERIEIRLTPRDFQIITDAAESKQIEKAVFVREAAVREAVRLRPGQ